MYKRKIFLVLSLIFSFFATNLAAQEVKQITDLSKVKVAELSDATIRNFIKEVEGAKLSNKRIEEVALSRGMTASEVKLLIERIEKIRKEDKKTLDYNERRISVTDSVAFPLDSVRLTENLLKGLKSKIFGLDFFKSKNNLEKKFETSSLMPAPKSYILGPGDELIIDVYGNSISNTTQKIDKDGNINVKYAGLVNLTGLTLEAATARLKQKLSSIYPDLSSGGTKLNVTVGSMRSIKIMITGEVEEPGSYLLPSVASVFNAIIEAKGPTENGSFRNVQVVRGGRVVAEVDLYDFLITGVSTKNVRLEDQDIIHVPYYLNRVEVSGEVKRPGIYELLPGENLNKLFYFAGDFTELAYKARVKVLKNTDVERKIVDVSSDKYNNYIVSSGDKVFVDEILDRFENRVKIEGAVFRPDEYELVPGLTLSKLIANAQGLKEDAFRERGYILRLQSNQEFQSIAFDLNAILSGKAADIPLMREDIVTIKSIFDLRENYTIKVDGEVQAPGQFKFGEGMTVEDAILMAGGFKSSATSNRVEISRRVKNSDVFSKEAIISEVFTVDVDPSLKNSANSIVLQPFDIVAVRPSTSFSTQKQIEIKGEVLYPGIFTLEHKNERITDLLKRAGGFTALAYVEGASLKRPGPKKTDLLNKEKQNNPFDVLTNTNDNEIKSNEYVGINLSKIMANPGSANDLFLEEGDILEIPKQLQTVKVSGEVLSPVTVLFEPHKGFKSYVNGAGGITDYSKLKRGYVKYANGSVKSTKSYLLFRSYPAIKPGAEIIIPKGNPRKPISITEIVGITSSLLTLILLFNQVSK